MLHFGGPFLETRVRHGAVVEIRLVLGSLEMLPLLRRRGLGDDAAAERWGSVRVRRVHAILAGRRLFLAWATLLETTPATATASATTSTAP
jgi:hypothetical protein